MQRPNSQNRRRIWRALIARDGKVCFYCGEEVFKAPFGVSALEHETVRYGTFDHLLPLSKGGTNEIKNLILACRLCHDERHK